MLRELAQEIADCVRDDADLNADGRTTVVVEDKADVSFEVSNALGAAGVCVLVAILGFRRQDRAATAQGDVEFQISCYEHPELNRADGSTLTAQGAMERIALLLHYRRLPSAVGQCVFEGFSREDVDTANIVRGSFKVHALLGERGSTGAER